MNFGNIHTVQRGESVMSGFQFSANFGLRAPAGVKHTRGKLLRLLTLMSVAIFATELTVTFGLGQIHLSRTVINITGIEFLNIQNTTLERFVDAVLLTIIVFPGLYFLVFDNLDQQNRKLVESENRLEQRVAQRTKELEQTVERATRQQQQIAALNEMGQVLQECRTPEEAYGVAGEQLTHLFSGLSGSLYLRDTSSNALERVAEWGEQRKLPINMLTNDALTRIIGKLHATSAQGDEIAYSSILASNNSQEHCVQLTAHGEVIGVLYLDAASDHHIDSGGNPLQNQMQFYETVAKNLALAISNLRLRELLQQQAFHDPLTGLPNRRFLIDTLEREMHRCLRHDQPLSVIMLDVDNFKLFNDKFGHEAGDAVLKELGAVLRNSVRGEDAVTRYGGEEFVVLLPGANKDVALRRAETLRNKIESLTVNYHGQPLGQVTVSAGIAVYPLHAIDPGALVRTADQAMYTSKRNGRNRVSFAPSLKPRRQADVRQTA